MAKKPTIIDGVEIPQDLIDSLDKIVDEEVDAKMKDIEEYDASGDFDKDFEAEFGTLDEE